MQQFTGIEYIKIDIANQYGLDKLTWNKRIKAADSMLDSSNMDHFIESADEPLLMQKAVYAYYDAQVGEPTGFIMGLDATSSFLQIMSLMIGDPVGAKYSNLINTGKRMDFYSEVTTEINELVTVEVPRDTVKGAAMPHYYNSKAEPKNVFGDATPELKAFYEVVKKLGPGAEEVMAIINSCWNPNTLEHAWRLPDGCWSKVKVMEPVDKKIEIDELGHATFTHRAYINRPSEYGTSLVANIVQSVDGYIVREMIRMANAQGWEILTIHDSFWCSPNHVNEMRENYVFILAALADMPLLANILNDITGRGDTLTKYTDNLGDLIRESEYALS